jgi:transcriptional regulator with XRE-family HTH domain
MNISGIDAVNLSMGRRLKYCREHLGLTQAQLAKAIQASQSCISLWENGVNGASVAYFFQLADALKVDARWLATGQWPRRSRRGPADVNKVGKRGRVSVDGVGAELAAIGVG